MSQGIFYVAGECNTIGEEEGEDCNITYAGSLEGEGIGALNIFKWASDFNIAPNSSMNVDRVKFNVYSNVASVNVSFRSDDAGVPGAEIVAPMSIVPTSQTLIGTSPSGANIYELVLDLPTAQNFEGGESGTNYWLGISTVMGSEGLLNFWEFADEINNGTNVYYSITGSTWSNAANAGYPGDAAFILEGTCIGGEEPPLVNDDCEGAIPVSCGETYEGTTLSANNSGGNDAGDVFYTFTGNGTEQLVSLSLCNSDYDTTIRVFTDCTLTEEVAVNDDSDECGEFSTHSYLTFTSDGTTQYVIMVEGYGEHTGNFELEVSCEDVVEEGDDCNITYAGSLEGEGIGALNIFKWASDFNIAPNSSMNVDRVKFNVYSNVASVNVSFRSDDAGVPGAEIVAPMSIVPTSQTLIGTSPSGANIYELVLDLPTAQNFEGGESGTNYWLGISTVMGSEGLLNFWEFADEINNGTNVYYSITGSTWSNAANAGYPGDAAFILEGTCLGGEEPTDDNDNCEDAIAISCGETVTGTTANATDSGFNPSADRFYSFTGDGTVQNVTISLCDSAFDTYLRVFSDCSLTNEIASNDDACGSRSRLTFESDGTSTYIIMVEGAGSNSGAYTLSVYCATPLGEPDYPCFQGDGLSSNGFEDAYNVSSASDTFRNADDFIVEDNNTFTMQYLRMNLFTIVGDDITSAQFNIRADEGGAPSETNIVDTFTAIPTSQTLIGTNYGYDVSEVEFVLDEDRPELPAGTYWLEPVVTAGLGLVWWEVTSTGSLGGVVHTSEDLGPWNPDPAGRQAVFFVAGECTELGVNDMDSFGFSYHPNPVKDVLNISSKKEIENVSVFNLAGQKVLDHAKVSNNQVDVNSLTPGTYVFKVTLKGGQIETFKILKK